jgi:hypothetical protein
VTSAEREANLPFREMTAHASRDVEAKCAAARHEHGVYLIDEILWREQVGLDGARRAAEHFNRTHGTSFSQNHRASGWTLGQGVVAHFDAVDGGDLKI